MDCRSLVIFRREKILGRELRKRIDENLRKVQAQIVTIRKTNETDKKPDELRKKTKRKLKA